MADPLDGMTWDKWQAMPVHERAAMSDKSQLNPQLKPYLHDRVEVETVYGETRRFWVGISTGWRPSYIEIHNTRSTGGGLTDKEYKSVKLVRRGPR